MNPPSRVSVAPLPNRRVAVWQIVRFVVVVFVCLGATATTFAQSQSKNLAPGFSFIPKNATVLIMPPDVELFSISGGGVYEPKADWTSAAHQHLHAAVSRTAGELGLHAKECQESDADEYAEISALHAAVARSIAFHHLGIGGFSLPTKAGLLDWSLGDAVKVIREKSSADYALFIWIRDSYASSERKAAMVALALLGVGVVGGMQIGYASLVDLNDGRIVWFNRLARSSGDLREEGTAAETVKTLFEKFPGTK